MNIHAFSGIICKCFCTKTINKSPKELYKHLIRECRKLPDNGPRKFYIHSVKQSFKQHVNENDPQRIKEIIKRAYEDADWVLKKMFQIPLCTSSNTISLENFWNAVLVYHNRPHLVNRRLLGVVNVLLLKVDFVNDNGKRLSEFFTRSAILYEIRQLKGISKEDINKDFIKNILETCDKNVSLLDASIKDFEESEVDIYVSVRILLPRQEYYASCIEVAILDKNNKVATFFAVNEFNKKILTPAFAYDIEFVNSGNLRICVQNIEDAESASAEWLCDQLFIKLLKWAEDFDSQKEIQHSLSLVELEKYTNKYHNLKHKYGDELIKKWPESTDPLKFVYEDVAIAAYLITLWEITCPTMKPKFVDLGCGNGLLVHILSAEGFPGYGIDIRKRRIWDFYPKTTVLKIETIIPSNDFLFPDSDWIIGNHSDELTPWIPVIAARSSYKTNFFLLPCCCYEFNGQKYKRLNSSVSIYTEYLEYIKNICTKSGFLTKLDKLRIPSTKRTCLVSFGRNYKEEDFGKKLIDLEELMSESENKENTVWLNSFQPRSPIEHVRNCTQLNKNVVITIIGKVTKVLLQENNILMKSNGETWNAGGTVFLADLVRSIGEEEVKQLKKECGGLQTLLRNHRYIFEVLKGCVKLRAPLTAQVTGSKYKNKPCWFYQNHPNGCLHLLDVCAYTHAV